MKIAIHPKEGRRNIFSLIIDEEEYKELHASIFGWKPSIKASNREELQEKLKELEYKGVKRFVLKKISMKSYYSGELKAALEERTVSQENIVRVIGEFQQQGYINDHEWTVRFIQRLHLQKQGPRIIQMKLRAKGVPEKEMTELIQSLKEEGSERENIIKLLKGRYSRRNLSDPKESKKVIAALVRKGYDLSEVLKVIKWYREEINLKKY